MAEYYRPRVPKGQHLGNSREQSDGVVGHLFDDENKLKGHAVWEKVEVPDDADYDSFSSSHEPEPPRQLTQEEIEAAAKVAALIVAGIVAGVQWASPHVKRWWQNKASPTLKSARKRVRRRNTPATNDLLQQAHLAATRTTFVASPTGVEIAVAASKLKMSSAEWRQRLQAILAASAFQEEQRRILTNAHIEHDPQAVPAAATADKLTASEFARHVQAVLEAHPSLLNAANSAELVKVSRVHAKLDGDEGNLALSVRRIGYAVPADTPTSNPSPRSPHRTTQD